MKTLKDYLKEQETSTNSDVGVSLSEVSKEKETEFHAKLDQLVHDTFGKRKDELEEDDRPHATRDYITKVIAGKIKPGLDPDGKEFEDEAYLYHTSELGRRDLMAQGGNWKAYYDAIKWWYKNTNESVEEGLMLPPKMEYKGWTYTKDVEEYEDNRKIFHSATKDGKEVSMDWSPYSTPTEEEFKLWVDLGMPTREAVNGIGPLDKDDLLSLAKTKQGTHAILKREDKDLNEIKRLSGLPINEDKEEDPLANLIDPKTKLDIMKAQVKNRGQSKGDPLAALAIELAKNVERLDKENDIEDAQIAAQELVDKMHTDAIAKLKKKPATVQEAFQYHIDNNIPIRENIFRPGSNNYFELFNYARQQVKEGNYTPDWEDEELLESDIGQVVKLANGYKVPLDQPFADDELSEAEYQGKKVELNKPKRGGSKKFYVYVKNPKTGKIKKVSWGDKGLSVKASKPGRVASFVARHKCKQKNDKTKAGYWACRTPRYKSLGVKGGQWW